MAALGDAVNLKRLSKRAAECASNLESTMVRPPIEERPDHLAQARALLMLLNAAVADRALLGVSEDQTAVGSALGEGRERIFAELATYFGELVLEASEAEVAEALRARSPLDKLLALSQERGDAVDRRFVSVAALRNEGLLIKADIVAGLGVLATAEDIVAAGLTRMDVQELHDQVKSDQVFALMPEDRWLYPLFQFEASRVRPVIAEILMHFRGRNRWIVADFLTGRTKRLAGLSPSDVIREGNPRLLALLPGLAAAATAEGFA